MKTIDRSALLPYAAQQLYDLVNDVEAYPQFMDGCVGASVLRREPGWMEARLDLARGGLRHSLITRNCLLAAREVTLELVDGPFEHFAGRWQFQPLEDAACKLSLRLEFQLNSALLGAAAGRMFDLLFDKVTNNMVDAISQRARQLYG